MIHFSKQVNTEGNDRNPDWPEWIRLFELISFGDGRIINKSFS